MGFPPWFELGSLICLGLILLADLLLVVRRPREPSMKEASAWVAFYVALALVFAVLIGLVADEHLATEFVAGWLTEYSLSLDNLFVFILIMAQLKVPRRYQQQVLMVGIVIALLLRAVFIVLGAQLIENFSWVFYIFGAWLLYVGAGQLRQSEEEAASQSGIVRLVGKVVPISGEFDANRLTTVVDGRRHLTPMVVVFITIGSTDLLFALDSIPAIFGLTRSPFIVFTANIFALMGLRQLYFLLGGLLRRLVYLNYGLAAILGFIGVKLILGALHHNELPFINGGRSVPWAPEVPIWLSLAVIAGSLAAATVASLIKTGRDRRSQ
ncbi:MAG: TerC/Alx family metal homeostasis membrane protein [Bifidobacteriaceae bacterium]|jgi:tellurite resistance protein TerC|nr:TerC/Alx family metal homeostasis membrane protein [Bifidobacteriaceae bacterium]